jgi:uncharacterized protein YqcC (DUF446 family)
MIDNTQLSSLLDQLEQQLQRHQLWQTQRPCLEALASREPFAIDALEPHEWLQWIFMIKIRAALHGEMALPRGFSITPYFEQAWAQYADRAELLVLLSQIDEVCQSC